MRTPTSGGPTPIQRFLEGFANFLSRPQAPETQPHDPQSAAEMGLGLHPDLQAMIRPPAAQNLVPNLLDDMTSSTFQEYMRPLEGPTRAIGALLDPEGVRNPFAAAASTDLEVGPDGNYQNTAPTTAQVLEERGVHPLLAMAADLALVPDPLGVGRAADLVPLLGLIGPGGLRAMARWGNDVQFVPASLLNDMAGNDIRRSADEMAEFRRMLASDPDGINDAAVIIYDPRTMRMYTGEGNHRTRAALEEDSPVPVRVVIGKVHEGRGLPIPPEGQAALRALADEAGYEPERVLAQQLGLSVYDNDSVLEYAARHAEDLARPLSDEELADMASVLEDLRRGLADDDNTLPLAGSEISRSPVPTRDFSPSIARFSGNQTPEEYVDELVELMGWERAMPYLMRQTGLNEQELTDTLQLWGDNYAEITKAMKEGGVLTRSPDMPTQPAYGPSDDPRLPRVDDPIGPGELDDLANEGAWLDAQREADAAGEAELGRPVNPQEEWRNLQEFIKRVEGAVAGRTPDEARGALDQLAADLEFENLREVDRARYERQIEEARLGLITEAAPRFSTGNPDWDTRVQDFSNRLGAINRAVDAGQVDDLIAREGNALFADMDAWLAEVRNMDPEAFANRALDLDEAMMLVSEAMQNIRKNIDPLGGGAQ